MITEECWMKYVETASVSAAARAWQSVWWISVAHNRPRVELPACDLLQSFTTWVKYISQFLPAITVLRFSLNLIFLPFPMVPVFSVFLRSEAITLSHSYTLSIKPSAEPLCWKEISHRTQRHGGWVPLTHLFYRENVTSVFNIQSIYLLSKTPFNMHNHQLICTGVCDRWMSLVFMMKQERNGFITNNKNNEG